MATLLPTILSDDEEDVDDKNAGTHTKKKKKKNKKEVEVEEDADEDFEEMELDFEFGGSNPMEDTIGKITTSGEKQGWSYESCLAILEKLNKDKGERMEVANIIAAARSNQKKQEKVNNDEDNNSSESSESEDEIDDKETANELERDELKHRGEEKNDPSDSEEDAEEQAKASAFFDSTYEIETQPIEMFSQLNLSRPLLRGVADMGFVTPTPIQKSVIPPALARRDICASAVTGSGKTAAFLLPVMEHILHRRSGRMSALVLTPTRELAAQCLSMATSLCKYTSLSLTLITGGTKNIPVQASELRSNPDIVIATPGRMLDLLVNAPSIHVDQLQFLVLDEADRLLDMGFFDEVMEIVKLCPKQRQTMLFSATMNNTKVDDLVQLSLNKPVRIAVNTTSNNKSRLEIPSRLSQEFIRIRPSLSDKRDSILLSLLTRTFQRNTMVFFDTKAKAHRFFVLGGLSGFKCAELHGNLTQVQRLQALEKFRKQEVDILFVTDVAARGLDIPGVENIINFEMPGMETYVHRCGRTARAGRKGRSCTLISEGRRSLMKKIIPISHPDKVKSRKVPSSVVDFFEEKIRSLRPLVEEVMAAEAVEKMDRIAEMEASKAENVIRFQNEIRSRPRKEWPVNKSFPEEEEKEMTQPNTGTHRMSRKKRRAREAREALLQAQEEARQQREKEGTPKKKTKVATQEGIKATARSLKNKTKSIETQREQKSISEEFSQRNKRRGFGDSNLFREEQVAFSEKKEVVYPSRYVFKEYDPNKKFGKGGRKGHHAFKSKSKYKRR